MKTSFPTKADLLNQPLVSIDAQHKGVTTNSLKIADYFGRRHANVLQRITNLIKSNRLSIQSVEYLDEHGQKRKYYILDRENFSKVALGFTGERAEDFRVKYVEQFEKNAAELIGWRATRQEVIEPTKACNDQIEALRLDLLKEIPESSKPKLLYLHIQQAITKSATGNSRIKRETMTAEQLEKVRGLESFTQTEIERLRGLEVPATEVRTRVLDAIKSHSQAKELKAA